MGVIYVLINEAMPNLVKIGKLNKEGRTVEDRMRELDTTSVPLPFECFSAWEVENVDKAERAIHQAFADVRIRARREFFRISPDKPTAILSAFGRRDVTPKDDVVSENADAEDDQRALDQERRKRGRSFSFDLVGIKEGETLESVFDSRLTCVVQDDRTVQLAGKSMSLSRAALTIAHDQGKNWKTINGPQYWKYRGKTLTELKEDGMAKYA